MIVLARITSKDVGFTPIALIVLVCLEILLRILILQKLDVGILQRPETQQLWIEEAGLCVHLWRLPVVKVLFSSILPFRYGLDRIVLRFSRLQDIWCFQSIVLRVIFFWLTLSLRFICEAAIRLEYVLRSAVCCLAIWAILDQFCLLFVILCICCLIFS